MKEDVEDDDDTSVEELDDIKVCESLGRASKMAGTTMMCLAKLPGENQLHVNELNVKELTPS